MLTRLKLTNFKCFKHLDLECSKLNLLCGMNSSGKSTVIQALTLLHQSWRTRELEGSSLQLRGNPIDLGSAEEVMARIKLPGAMGISLSSDETSHEWIANFDFGISPEDRGMFVIRGGDGDMFEPGSWDQRPPFNDHTISVGAERIGPRSSYPLPENPPFNNANIGRHSEYALYRLVEPPRLGQGESRSVGFDPDGALNLVNHWLQQISPGVRVGVAEADIADTLLARFWYADADGEPRGPYRPQNVGFGLSYVLPVIIALLSPAGTLCLIENPEAHLHPQGQTVLGELAARAAVDGVQVIAETHSDHFVDGVRIAVRDGVIRPEHTKFHHFTINGGVSSVTSPQIDEDGRLSEWPAGFFDQTDFNLDRLLEPRS